MKFLYLVVGLYPTGTDAWLILVVAFIIELVFFIKRKKRPTLLFLLVGIMSFRFLPINYQKFAIRAGIVFIIGIVFFVLEFLYCQSWMKKFKFHRINRFFDTCFFDIGKNKQFLKKIIVLNELFFYF